MPSPAGYIQGGRSIPLAINRSSRPTYSKPSEPVGAYNLHKLLASATLDRMRHNAYCLVLDGKSYRAPRQLPGVIRTRLANDAKTAQA